MPRYDKKTIDQAKELFMNGLGCRKITEEFRIGNVKPCPNVNTVQMWATKYKWSATKEKIKQKSESKLVETMSDVKLRQLSICRLPQEFLLMRAQPTITKLKAGQITMEEAERKLKAIGSWEAVAGAMKHELLLWGEATDRIETNQFSWATAYGNLKKKPEIIEEKKE